MVPLLKRHPPQLQPLRGGQAPSIWHKATFGVSSACVSACKVSSPHLHSMAPRTRQRTSIAQRSSQGARAGLLDELPQTAAAVIYQCLDARSRTSLAAVCRWARDLVLREARSLELQVHSSAARKPLSRLLSRVCSAAQAGRLSLTLQAHGFTINSKSNVLSDLLAPAKQQGGWASVKELALKVGGPCCVSSTRARNEVEHW
jgi:hypothetical protein